MRCVLLSGSLLFASVSQAAVQTAPSAGLDRPTSLISRNPASLQGECKNSAQDATPASAAQLPMRPDRT